MAISKSKAILRLFNETLKNGLEIDENENISNIIQICEKNGKYIFHIDSYWCFVKTTRNHKQYIRMIFALKENEGGKIQNIDRIIEIIRNVESVLLYVNSIDIVKSDKFIYLDIFKNLKNSCT